MVIYNAVIYTMESEKPIENGCIETENGKITKIYSGMPKIIGRDDYNAEGLAVVIPLAYASSKHLSNGFMPSTERI